ncbi:MAG TPA: DUF362 domain-containing protein [Anaeromyxobacter sp.]|nr:DUF362 domain-containing protein [Anaeromyxobacter sp.]
MMKCTSRREFVRLAVGAGMAAGCTRKVGDSTRATADASTAASPSSSATPARSARVHVARGKDLAGITRAALDSLGGIGMVVKAGDRVFLKPNMVTLPWADMWDPFTSGECTKPEVVVAVAEACLEAGAAAVTIGDGSQRPRFDWARAHTLDGSTNLVEEAGRLEKRHGRPVKLACLEVDTPEWIEVPTRNSYGKVAVSSLALHADKVISIPVAKTHRYAYFTLSLKNFVGVTALARYQGGTERNDRWRLHARDMSPLAFNTLPQDIARAVKPVLAVIDFSIGMEGDGPSVYEGGLPLDVSRRVGDFRVLASKDLVAADSTAARIMSQDEARIQEVLGMARADGLGAMHAEEITVVGGTLETLRIPWKAARPQNAG